MKSYTDLEQSKKLAEILPIESADITLCNKYNALMTPYLDAKKSLLACTVKEDSLHPCWSLTALLEILPDTITSNDGIAFKLNIQKNIIEYSNYSLYLVYKSVKSDNFIDACVAMIEKLHELNLL